MDELLKLLAEVNPDIDFVNQKNLYSSGALNSLTMISIIYAISNAYGIQIPFTEIIPDNFESAETIFSMIQRLK